MADFDLTQTDVQVQSILNDAQNAQGAGAQTTLTTDYIMLKDTSGSYHKILKDSFTEACRNVLAGLLVNNNKGTSVSQIPVVASGDFGSVTPVNLASVLGGARTIISSNTDLNNITTFGRYACTSISTTQTLSNCPVSSAFTLDVIPTPSETYYSQILYAATSPGPQIWIRRKDQTGFAPWIRIGSYITGIMPNNTDVKELPEGRYFKNTAVTGVTGYPSQVAGSFIVEVVYDSTDNSSNHIWLYDIASPGAVYFNIKWNGGWRGWRKVTATTVEE